MLARWSVQNFKSFRDTTTLELAPITVLAGANSSGKSSLIQSILLLKQTVQYIPESKSIGLNGPLLKLGRFDDIHNSPNDSEDILFGWELTNAPTRPDDVKGPSAASMPFTIGGIKTVASKFQVAFGIPSDLSRTSEELTQLQPILKYVKVDLEFEVPTDDPIRHSTVTFTRRPFTEEASSAEFISRKPDILSFDVEIDERGQNEIFRGRPEATIVGGDAKHFLPRRIAVRFNQRRLFSKQISEILSQMAWPHVYVDPTIRGIRLPRSAVQLVLKPIVESVVTAAETQKHLSPNANIVRGLAEREFTVQEFVNSLGSAVGNIRHFLTGARASLAEIQPDLEGIIFREIDMPNMFGTDFGLPSLIQFAADNCSSYFSRFLHYLGPLRDEPRPIYPLEAVLNPTDVGYRGEHTAAVLDLHRDTVVEYIRSAELTNLLDASIVAASLSNAVKDWLSYLGVAESVSTTDRGKMGHTLQVRVGPNRRDHDLTHVGVGVSQLLPIVVMALLAPPGSLLIFEQPELHLHPKVQARLADFFISLALSNKQCILETHSEYLVERFRLRIAQSKGESLNELIKIFFTEKQKNDSTCREVKLTRFGAVIDWPADFFDQAQTETQAILRASQDKRKSEARPVEADK